MTDERKYPLYELSEQEFERLCVDLLLAANPQMSASTVEIPRWIDAVAKERVDGRDRAIAIEVKHRMNFHPEGLRLFLERLSKESPKFDEYIFITSSPIGDIHRQLKDSAAAKALNAGVQILGRAEITQLLDLHPTVAMKYFKSARDRVKRRQIAAWLSSLALTISLGGLTNALYSLVRVERGPKSELTEQLGAVEASLARLRDLERSLTNLKKELQEKSQESARIVKEYEEAMKLKALTAEQLDQIKKVVNTQSRMDVFLNYLWGFLLGVAGSILATILVDMWKRRRALQRPYP
ncbi:MAG: hypothetical protein ACT6UH_05685 [Hydrogenophaga sp.]|jgi:hypothetical protein|uniref:hypothetical protein n=1 Tax=Hydrogenophaga sp. TaxID=1904254 RepID=UPI0040354B57